MKRACVIGWPIAHSRSPLIHGYWLKKYGIDGSYTKEAVKPEELEQFLKSLSERGFVGCNVTIPHKEAAFARVDEVDERGRRCGSINTIYQKNGKLLATTTDGIGFCNNVEESHKEFSFRDKCVFIYGTGGSARPIIDEALRRGAKEILLTNRTMERAEELAQHFGKGVRAKFGVDFAEALPHCDLLVNCTSLGMNGQGVIDLPLERLAKTALVADIVYVPLVTDFLVRAKALGLRIVPGLGMLLHQAAPGFELWFGVKPEVTRALRDLVEADIEAPSTKAQA